MSLFLHDIDQALNFSLSTQYPDIQIHNICFDSRKCQEGDLFVALQGDRDGHDFVPDAIANGAKAIMLRQDCPHDFSKSVSKDVVMIPCLDPLVGLQKLAVWKRKQLECPWIAITGSNGKTTTKEWITHLLSKRWNVGKNLGNFNNHIGLPISILNLPQDTQVVVLEMGMNHAGEIAELCEIARPNVGLITNIGHAHIGNFENIETLAMAKEELYCWIERYQEEFSLIFNLNDFFVKKMYQARKQHHLKSYAIGEKADWMIQNVRWGKQYICADLYENYQIIAQISLPFLGQHHLGNALAAISVARQLSMSWEDILGQLDTLELPKQRGTVYFLHDWTIVDESYNANPDSMRASLDAFFKMPGLGKKYVVCGDMLELGSLSQEEHSALGAWIAQQNVDGLWGYGPWTRSTIDLAQKKGLKNAFHFEDITLLVDSIKLFLKAGDMLFIKGSRANRLERILETLR